MPLFTIEEIMEVTGARLVSGDFQQVSRGGVRRLCTDSRTARRGDLFIALAGEQFDGHRFVEAALRLGAVGAIVQAGSWDQPPLPPTAVPVGPARGRKTPAGIPLVLLVPDSLLAFQQLASHHRSRFRIPLVAVTGSNGKTTTKEMVALVLAERGTVLKTEGNLNNRIGVPLTLLRLTARHDAAVVEMGVDRKGQTTRLCEIAKPTVGVITNIGPDHLEFFGSMEVSAQAKGELLDLLPDDGAVALNADDPYFGYLAARAGCRVVSFGLAAGAQVRALDVAPDPRGQTFQLMLPDRARGTRVLLPAHGAHNLSNALAAAAVGYALGLSGAAIARGLSRFKPATMRSEVTVWKGLKLINDCYNANPASMKAAITLLAGLAAGGRSIAVLGDMLELGPEARAFHQEVGAYLAGQGIAHLIACGTFGHDLAEGARKAGLAPERIKEAPDSLAAGDLLKDFVQAGDVVLVKASRGMRMERVIESLLKGKGRWL